MSITWVLIADGSRARLFENARRDEPLHQLESFLNADARLPGRQLTTGRLPTVNESMGYSRHSIEPHTTLREKQMAGFAKELADALERGRTARRYDRLILVAPPKFLGALHDCFDKPLRNCVIGELRRDITTLSEPEIHERVARLLEPAARHSRIA